MLCTILVIQIFLGAVAILFLVADFLESSTERTGANIGTPVVIAILLSQLILGVVALVRSQSTQIKSKG